MREIDKLGPDSTSAPSSKVQCPDCEGWFVPPLPIGRCLGCRARRGHPVHLDPIRADCRLSLG